ncbi:MAG TPA: hypothetical protein VN657_01425 [Nitrospiraceae bacterium]|jgi:hypothetical protein|nr:hypothetical protein [Nitrospiraceae bacterium]
MTPFSKTVCVISCGILMGLGLSYNAALAAQEMKANQSGERIGGQAGLGYEQGKREPVHAQAGERIGGQAGLGYEQVKSEVIHAQPGERIGGQAGLG